MIRPLCCALRTGSDYPPSSEATHSRPDWALCPV